MKNNLTAGLLSVLSLVFFPVAAHAQIADSTNAGAFEDLLINILIFSNDILIPFIIGIGFLFFVWGMFLFFILGGADEEKKLKGRSLMIHATIGFVVIIIFFGIVNMIASSTGLEGETIDFLPEISVPG